MKALLLLSGLVFLVACDSRERSSLLAPTTVPQPAPPSPGPNTREPGPVAIASTALSLGAEVDVIVLGEDPQCFSNWDSAGRCHQFEVTTPADGTLVASMTIGLNRGSWNPDVFLSAPDGDWSQPDFGWPITMATMSAQSGLTYRVTVMSYGPFPDPLRLRVELR